MGIRGKVTSVQSRGSGQPQEGVVGAKTLEDQVILQRIHSCKHRETCDPGKA